MYVRRIITRAAMALLLTAATLPAVTGCTQRAQTFSSDASEAETTGAAGATATAETSATTGVTPGGGSSPSGGSGGSAGSSSSKLSTKDASALDAELSAIQSELDRLSLPSDSDFDSIGSGLE